MLSSIPAVSSLHFSTQTHVTDRRFTVYLIIATYILSNFCLKNNSSFDFSLLHSSRLKAERKQRRLKLRCRLEKKNKQLIYCVPYTGERQNIALTTTVQLFTLFIQVGPVHL